MKFRNSIFTLMLMFVATFGLQAQDSGSPISQGDFMVNLTEVSVQADIDGTTVSTLPINASVGYALTDQIVLGVGALEGTENSWETAIYGRYYLSSPFYVQGSLSYDSDSEETNFAVSGGVTGFLGNSRNLYIEPNIQFNLLEDISFEVGVNFGVRF